MRFRQIRLILSLISAFSSALPVLIFAIGGIAIVAGCILTNKMPEDLPETLAFCISSPLAAAGLLCGTAGSIWLYAVSGSTGQIRRRMLWIVRSCLLLPPLIAIVILLAMDGFNPAGPHEMGIYSRFALKGAVLAVITWLLPTKSKANPSETSENYIKE